MPSDDVDALLGATERLLSAVLQRNEIEPDDLVSIMFTATDDLRSAFPAEAARRIGLARVPLMCARRSPSRDRCRRSFASSSISTRSARWTRSCTCTWMAPSRSVTTSVEGGPMSADEPVVAPRSGVSPCSGPV